MSKRIAVYVDGFNFFCMQKDFLKWWIDPKRLLRFISRRGEIADAFYFVSVDADSNKQEKYLHALTHMGYDIIVKTVKARDVSDESLPERVLICPHCDEEFTMPSNDYYPDSARRKVSADLAAHMLAYADKYDEVVLVSGDADFVTALEIMKEKKKSFYVVGAKHFSSSDLRQVAGSNYEDLTELRSEIEKEAR